MCESKNSASEVQEVDVPDKIMPVLKQIWTELRNLKNATIENQEQMQQVRKQLQELDRKFAGLSEASVRAFGAYLFGASFAKRHLALKLEDLVFLVAKGKDSKLKSNDSKQQLAAARVMAEALEPSIQPLIDRLIAVMREDPEVAKETARVKDLDEAKSAVDANDLKRAVDQMIKVASLMKKEQWKKFLVRLKKAVSSTDCIDELLSCGGPGIMLAGLMSKAMMWRSAGKNRKSASIQDYLLEVKNPFTEFSEEVEFDMRGTILLVSPHVTVAVGEIKSFVSHLDQAKAQLSYRCALLLWTVKIVLPSKKYKDHTMIGHIFVPRLSLDMDRDAEVGSDGISYYVHRVDSFMAPISRW